MSDDEPKDESTDASEQQSDQEPADSDQPSAQSDDAPSDGEQPTEQSDEQPADSDQSTEQAEEQPTDSEQSAGQSDDQSAEVTDQSAEQSGATSTDESEQATEQQAADQAAEQGGEVEADARADEAQTAATGELSAKRQSMLDLIDKWMPTSLNNPRVPEGETQDLMAKAGWTKATGQYNKKLKDDGKVFATSCGDILAAMLRLWGSNFVGAFNIRDQDSKGRSPGAKGLGFYVEADGVQSPQPGDIIVLRNGVGKSSAGTAGHVGILVEAGETEWRTADGGGGALPDQTASVTTRTVRLENNIPILKSPTDLKEKQLDGWVDLDKLEQTG
jgi:hypothetical protein